jgi:putative acetyltransferase
MKNNDISIRACAPQTDTPALSQIWLEASRIAHAFIGDQRRLDQQALIETRYLPGAESWVACVDDVPAGFISLLDTLVGGIFVAPQWQRLGIGRRLIAHALNLRGELSLEVYTRNTGAMRFYASLGFEELSRRASDDEGLPFENALLRLKK